MLKFDCYNNKKKSFAALFIRKIIWTLPPPPPNEEFLNTPLLGSGIRRSLKCPLCGCVYNEPVRTANIKTRKEMEKRDFRGDGNVRCCNFISIMTVIYGRECGVVYTAVVCVCICLAKGKGYNTETVDMPYIILCLWC